MSGIAVPAGVAELDTELELAAVALATAAGERDVARVAVADAEVAAGQHRTLAECERLLELHERRDVASNRLAEARTVLDLRVAALAGATARAGEVRAQVAALAGAVQSCQANVETADLRGASGSANGLRSSTHLPATTSWSRSPPASLPPRK